MKTKIVYLLFMLHFGFFLVLFYQTYNGEISEEHPYDDQQLMSANDEGEESSRHNENYALHLQILSSRNRVYVNVNSKQIYDKQSGSMPVAVTSMNTTDGLHILVIDPNTGNLMIKRKYYTQLFGEGIGIPPLLNSIGIGEIIVFAVKFDAGLNLSKNIRLIMHSLGSLSSYRAVYCSYFVWVFANGGKSFAETFINDDASFVGDFTSSPALVDIFIPKANKKSCWQEDGKEHFRRSTFCAKYSGYGNLCDCDSPAIINFNTSEIKGSVIKEVPIVIIASNRPQSLYRCLITLLEQPGGFKNRIIVMVDGVHEEVQDLLKLLKITYVVNDMSSLSFPGKGARIAVHYKFALQESFNRFPKSQYVIVFEEDLLASPDFISFFNQTAGVLAMDNSLYCVSAWNDLSAMHTGGDPHRVMRTETQPAYGWMITKDFFYEVANDWPSSKKELDWDIWIRGPWVRTARECLIPEVSRSFHMGESGVHIGGQLTYAQFAGHLTTGKENIFIENIDRLTQYDYEEDIYNFLESDQVMFLKTTLSPCHKNYLPKYFYDKTIVIFMWMVNQEDGMAWTKLSSCIGVFNLDLRNHHRGLIRLFFYDTKVIIIGYPFSDYSYLKPNHINVLHGNEDQAEIKELSYVSLMNRVRFRVPNMEKKLPYKLLLEKPNKKPFFKYFQ